MSAFADTSTVKLIKPNVYQHACVEGLARPTIYRAILGFTKVSIIKQP